MTGCIWGTIFFEHPVYPFIPMGLNEIFVNWHILSFCSIWSHVLLAIREVLDHTLISLSLLFERVSDTRTESSASKLFARAFNLLPRHAKFINSCSLYLKVAQIGEAINLHIPSKTNFTLAGPHGAILRTAASEHESMITKVNVLISQAYHVQSVSAMIRSAAVVWRITRWQWLLCSTLLTLRTSGVKWKFRSQTATCVIRK